MIAVERAHLHVAALSHPGMSGKNNEDRYSVSAHQIGSAHPKSPLRLRWKKSAAASPPQMANSQLAS
jgi:hypothetical protein